MVIKVKDPCLQRLTLGKVVMGQQDPNQGHELEIEAPEHGQRDPTEMITYREKKNKLRKIPWLTPQLHFIHPFLSTTWEFLIETSSFVQTCHRTPLCPSKLLPLRQCWSTTNQKAFKIVST